MADVLSRDLAALGISDNPKAATMPSDDRASEAAVCKSPSVLKRQAGDIRMASSTRARRSPRLYVV